MSPVLAGESHGSKCGECGTPVFGAVPARPYTDLKDDNEGLRRSLTEALEQQTATSKILRAISQSPTNVQPQLGKPPRGISVGPP